MSVVWCAKNVHPFNWENEYDNLFSFYYVHLHCDNFAYEPLLHWIVVVVGKPHCWLASYGQLVVLQASFP